jgi:type VI protein secretion system component VasF
MNHSAKKQHHELARKKHKHELQAHAREASRRQRSLLPLWFLIAGLVVIATGILMISFL